jgi:uncharacterized membrane protein YeiB
VRRWWVVVLLAVGFAAVAALTGVQTASDEPRVVLVSRVGIGVVSVLVGSGIVWLRRRGARRDEHEAECRWRR